MFIGRERELATLNKLYASDKFEFVVIYGRRRVGKTALISQFIDDKNAIYFMGVESNAKQNLENFSKSILSYHTGMDAETSFLSFQAALEYMFKLSEKERIILAIDEYPYVARASKSLASTLQLLIDKNKDSSKLTDEQVAIYQSQVDECYQEFVNIVADGRDMSADQVKALADGRTYTAKQARLMRSQLTRM